MPNWCENKLTVSGDKKEIKKFKLLAKGKDSDLILNNFVPLPKNIKEKEGAWYEWQIENWGTKWDINAKLTYNDENYLEYEFDSAWSPPSEWIKQVGQKYKKLDFRLKYDEPGVGFMGMTKSTKGKFTDDLINY
jgi:hypothetical protein